MGGDAGRCNSLTGFFFLTDKRQEDEDMLVCSHGCGKGREQLFDERQSMVNCEDVPFCCTECFIERFAYGQLD